MSEVKKPLTFSEAAKSCFVGAFAPSLTTAFFLNTALIQLTFAFLAASERIKTRDQKTLLNVYREAPGNASTQIAKYIEGFYESMWNHFVLSSHALVGDKMQIAQNFVNNYINIPENREKYNEIMKILELPEMPSPNPSPINVINLSEQSSSIGVV